MTFPYKCVLVTGATSGIGLALTENLINHGSFVVAVGRRRDRLDQLLERFGPDKIAIDEFDISATDKLKPWVESLISNHPNLDAILLNAGFQHHPILLDAENLQLDTIEEELRTNYLSPLQTTLLLLPHLQALSKKHPTAIINVTSGLSIVPSLKAPTYSATKAALHSFTWSLRATLADDYPNLKVVELVPPAVQTELHTKQGAPSMGMPMDEYIEETWEGLMSGKEEIPAGMIAQNWIKVEDERKKAFAHLASIDPAPKPT